MRRKKICPCGEKSVPGLIKSVALCQKHFNGLIFGFGAEHSEAVLMYRLNKCREGSRNLEMTY